MEDVPINAQRCGSVVQASYCKTCGALEWRRLHSVLAKTTQ